MNRRQKRTNQRRPRATGTKLTRADRGVVLTVPKSLAFPTVQRTTLKYDMYFDASLTANVFTYYEFAANGCYDPDLSGTGHQPYMFDNYTDRYTKYRVYGFRYDVSVPLNSNETAYALKIGTQVRNDTYTPTYPAYFEQPYTKTRAGAAGTPSLALRGKSNLSKISARPENYMNDDRYSSVYNSNPAELISFYVGFLSNQENSFRTFVTLYYDVEFFDPHPVASSLDGTKGVRLNRSRSMKNIK